MRKIRVDTDIGSDIECHFERGRVEVELGSRRLEGLTYFTADESGNDLVALRVMASGSLDTFLMR